MEDLTVLQNVSMFSPENKVCHMLDQKLVTWVVWKALRYFSGHVDVYMSFLSLCLMGDWNILALFFTVNWMCCMCVTCNYQSTTYSFSITAHALVFTTVSHLQCWCHLQRLTQSVDVHIKT